MKTVTAGTARARYLAAAAALGFTLSGAARAQPTPETVVDMLSDGGYVLVMRHASSPREAPSGRQASARNRSGERELDDEGRASSSAVGYAFRALGVDVGEVLSSPAFRAVETAIYLGYADPETVEALAPGGDAAWLRRKAAEAPADGTNTLIITHAPVIQAAFGDAAAGMSDGETLVVRPGADGGSVVGRLTVRDWAVVAVDRSGS